MKERLINYTAKIDALLNNPDVTINWEEEIKLHLTQISFFMHERLIHLIVTVWVSILLFLTMALCMITQPSIMLLCMMTLFLVLLIPYIMHYYRLENGVQYLYRQYDRMVEFQRKKETNH